MDRIRIGIDGRQLCLPLSGIGRYLYNALDDFKPELFEVTLITHRPIIFIVPSHIRLSSSKINSRLGRMVWSQTVLPYKIYKGNFDIFWNPSHRLPFLKFGKTRYIMTLHDLVCIRAGWSLRFSSRILDLLLIPLSLVVADHVICVSANTQQDLSDLFPKLRAKSTVCYPGLTKFNTTHRAERSAVVEMQKRYILFVGTIEPRKNIEGVIAAYSKCDPSIQREYNLVIVGGIGWGGIDVDNVSKRYGVEKNVIFLGHIPDSTLSLLYQSASLFFWPSFYEGFGYPVIEAMKYGAPIITSKNSSLIEIAAGAAILVDPQNILEMAANLERVLRDEKLQARLH